MSKQRIEDFYEQILESDGDFEAVADPVIADLNAAMEKYKNQNRTIEAQKVADCFNDFIKTFYPASKLKYDGQMIIELMDFEKKFSNVNDATEVFNTIFNRVIKKIEVPKKKTLESMVKEKGW